MSKITGRDRRVADWLEKIGIDPKATRRVVIDISVDSPIWVYIEQFGDSRMFEVEPPPELTTAIRVQSPQADFEEAIKLIKGLKVSEQPILPIPPGFSDNVLEPTDYDPDKLKEYIKQWKNPDD